MCLWLLNRDCEQLKKFVSFIPHRGIHSKWPWAWEVISPLGEEFRGSWVPSLEPFLNGDVAPSGVNFGKQISVSLVLFYLISLLFACENTFLGFELDLLIYMFIVRINLWIFTSRNPWYLYFCSIYFSYIDSNCLLSVVSYTEFLGKSSGYSKLKTRSFRA